MKKINIQATKKWYESKTMWVNILLVVGGFLTALAGEIQEGTSVSIVGLINIFFRYLTKAEIKW